MARSVTLYRNLGPQIAHMTTDQDMSALALLLVQQLRIPPPVGSLRNALQHMWGYISEHARISPATIPQLSHRELLTEIQNTAQAINEPYLTTSTALSELGQWLPPSTHAAQRSGSPG